ncbi:MAG: D-2-hydroxyacid dehydrogenase [Betaproteobacteria bacterium]|nr:D-2-hydroxyacid dehydrogenase [Betaproteobacteria bacterium]
MSKPVCIVWMNESKVYERALARAGLADRFELHGVRADQAIPAELAARCEVLLAWHPAPGLIAGMPRLRWIQSSTAGMDQWLKDPGLRDAVILACARGSHRIQMPENILAALFFLTKPLMQCALDQRESRWTRRISEPLAGKTLGILGLGAIGRELARKAAALELRVIGTKRSPAPVEHVDKVYPPEATDEVLGAADFVLLLLPSTAETVNFMNAQRLAAMRRSAWLLNFARGALIVDADLIDAVRAKTIAGAVLDVYRNEPLPADHPFWTTEGIVVLPHIGGLHPARDEGVAEVFIANARRFVAGEPLETVVDRRLGY